MINVKQAIIIAEMEELSKNFKLTEEVMGKLYESIEKEANLGEFKLRMIHDCRDIGSHWLVNKYVLDEVSKSLKKMTVTQLK